MAGTRVYVCVRVRVRVRLHACAAVWRRRGVACARGVRACAYKRVRVCVRARLPFISFFPFHLTFIPTSSPHHPRIIPTSSPLHPRFIPAFIPAISPLSSPLHPRFHR
jgi:hypothetical protein